MDPSIKRARQLKFDALIQFFTKAIYPLHTLEFNKNAAAGVARCFVVLYAILLNNCGGNSMIYVESANQNSRIDYIVIHGTSEHFAESLRLLTTRTANPVSAHYLVPTTGDPTYPHKALRVHSLVAESSRAWHAGLSYWQQEIGLNDRSIGVEVVNEFKCTVTEKPLEEIVLEDVSCDFLPYSEVQIQLLIDLLSDILSRYPQINPIDIVGHSDIAIMRRSDPGPLFPWQRLYQEGIGAWPDAAVIAKYHAEFSAVMPAVATLQKALSTLGYQVEITDKIDAQTQFALRAFQMHFRPADYSGQVDNETAALLWALLEKYRPNDLINLR